MRLRFSSKVIVSIMVMSLSLVMGGQAQSSNPVPMSATTVPQSDQIQPAQLASLLKPGLADRPVVFQVGSFVMFQQAHIPNAGFAGPGSRANGMILLKKFSAPLSKKQLIVIYCGCCPWNKCPNIGPAYKQLHDLGFTNVKALFIASNFGDDWVSKGYPVEKGE
jgi:thiosulfate/3-mercaptopyruvate sulfurtransferase